MTEPQNIDMAAIIAQAEQLQAQLMEAQKEISETTVTGVADHGRVKVAMLGAGTVSAITIDPAIVDPEDVETLQDLIVVAINDAHATLAALAEERMRPLQDAVNFNQ